MRQKEREKNKQAVPLPQDRTTKKGNEQKKMKSTRNSPDRKPSGIPCAGLEKPSDKTFRPASIPTDKIEDSNTFATIPDKLMNRNKSDNVKEVLDIVRKRLSNEQIKELIRLLLKDI